MKPKTETWPDLKDLNTAILKKGMVVVRRKPPDDTYAPDGKIVMPDQQKGAVKLPVGRVVKIPSWELDEPTTAMERKTYDKAVQQFTQVGDVLAFHEYDAVALPEEFGDDLLLLAADDAIFRFPKEKNQ